MSAGYDRVRSPSIVNDSRKTGFTRPSGPSVIGKLPRAALNLRSWASVGWLTMFGDESFEFVGRDQSCAPGHLDRLDVWQDAPDKGGATDAERLGGLAAGVGEPLDTRRLPDCDTHASVSRLLSTLIAVRRHVVLRAAVRA